MKLPALLSGCLLLLLLSCRNEEKAEPERSLTPASKRHSAGDSAYKIHPYFSLTATDTVRLQQDFKRRKINVSLLNGGKKPTQHFALTREKLVKLYTDEIAECIISGGLDLLPAVRIKGPGKRVRLRSKGKEAVVDLIWDGLQWCAQEYNKPPHAPDVPRSQQRR